MQVETTPVASVGHSARAFCPRRHARALVAEQMDRIILDHADQGEAEGDGDAVHAVEQQRHRAQAGQPGAGQRQHAEHRHLPAAIGDHSNRIRPMRVDHADPLRLGLRCGRRSRPRTRPGRSAPVVAVAVAARPSRTSAWIASTASLLAGGIETGRAGLRHQQGAACRRGRTRHRAGAAARSPAASVSASFSVSRVGSDASSGSISAPAGEPRSCTRASSSSRQVGAVERCVSSVGDSR